MPEDQIETCERINEFYPSKNNKAGWLWRNPFRTNTFEIEGVFDKDAFFAKLDESLQSICEFEDDLKEKLQ